MRGVPASFDKTNHIFIYRVDYTVVDRRDGSEKRYTREIPSVNIKEIRKELSEDINHKILAVERYKFRPDKIAQVRRKYITPYSVKDVVITRLREIKRGE